VAEQIVQQCDSFAFVCFSAPESAFAQHKTQREEYRILPNSSITPLTPAQEKQIQESFKAAMNQLLKERLTEKLIKEKYASMADTVLMLLEKRRWFPKQRKEQKADKAKKEGALPSPPNTASSSPLPTEPPATQNSTPSPSLASPPSPPLSNHKKPLLLLLGLAVATFLLWKAIPRIRSWWLRADPALAKIEKS
jgi:hypothetical protein